MTVLNKVVKFEPKTLQLLVSDENTDVLQFACVFLFVNYVLCTVVVFAFAMLKMYL